MERQISLARIVLTGMLAFGALHATDTLRAQEPGSSVGAQSEIESVVVTGRASIDEVDKVDVSYAVTTIGDEALRMNAPLGVADALDSVPGFWVESTGGVASANIRARGIPQEGFSAVGMQEDGLPIQHDAGLGWLNADQSFRLDETIERIEVVRGGPASMFSSNAPGGLVNFVTRQAGDTAEGVLKVETSDYGLMRADGWYGAPFGDDWHFGVGGFYRVDDGVRDPGFRANEGGQVRFSLGRDLERGAVDLNIKHIDDNVIFYTGLPLTYDDDHEITGIPGVDAKYGTLAGAETRRFTLQDADGPRSLDVERGTDVELTQLTATFEHELGNDWRFYNGFRYRESETARIGLFPNTPTRAADRLNQIRPAALALVPGATDVGLRYVSSPGTVFDVEAQNGNGLILDGSLREVSVPLDEWINDFRLLRTFDSGRQSHEVAFGLYTARVEETFQRYSANSLLDVRDHARRLDIVALDADGEVVAPITEDGITRYGAEFANGTGESTTWAFYVSDEWQITDKFRLDLGARYEQVEVEGTVEGTETVDLGGATIADDDILAGTGAFDAFNEEFEDVGWTIGANWQLQPHSGVFLRYTSTFRLPNVGSYITNATAQPVTQTMDFTEVGYKYSRDAFAVYATLFNTTFDSLGFSELVFDPDSGSFVSRTSYTDTDTTGLELEATIGSGYGLEMSVSGTWQDPQFGRLTSSELDEDGELVITDYTGNQLIRVPKLSFRFTPALNLLDGDLRLEVDYQYFHDRYADAANSVELPDYDAIHLNLRYAATDSVSIYLRGENLLDEVGLTEGNPRAGQFQSGEADSPFFVGRPIYGRNYRLSFLWNF